MFPNSNLPSGASRQDNDESKAAGTPGFCFRNTAGPSLFASTSNTSSYSTGLFGSANNQNPVATTGFGGFGSQNSNGTVATGASQQKNLFDDSGSGFAGFGRPPPVPFANSTSVHNIGPDPGTKNVSFQHFIEKEANGTICRYKTINFLDPYKNHSLEELRLADYMQDSQHDNDTPLPSIFSGQAAQLVAPFHVPVAMPAFVPFTVPVSTAEVLDVRNSRKMPRRSNRDRDMISQCEDPDPVAIIAEHFADEVRTLFRAPTPDAIFDESNQPVMEALFEVGDLVNLKHEQKPFPANYRPSKIVARHFNDNGDSEDDSDDDMELNRSRQDAREESNSDTEVNGIGDLLGKRGWFYKLSRHFKLNGRYAPITVLWHEEDLDLALEDDSSDDDDKAEQVAPKAIVEDKLGDQDGGPHTIEVDEEMYIPDHGETASQEPLNATSSMTEHE